MKLTIKKITTRVLWFTACSVFAMLVLNSDLFDERPSPELIPLLETPKSVMFDQNGYIPLSGLMSKDATDIDKVGENFVAMLDQKYADGDPIHLSEHEHDTLFGGQNWDNPWQVQYSESNCNSRIELGCFVRLYAQIEAQPEFSERLHVMIDRYKSVRQHQHFVESAKLDWTSPLPPFNTAMQLSRINLVEAYRRGGLDLFIQEFIEERRFWTMVLEESNMLLSKMVAISVQTSALQYLSEILNQSTYLDAPIFVELERHLLPLNQEERDIGEAFLSEQGIISRTGAIFTTSESTEWMFGLFEQPQATENLYFRAVTQRAIKLASLDALEFSILLKHREEPPALYQKFPPTLYNLGGKIRVSRLNYSPKDYIARVHDFDGLLVLLKLQLNALKAPSQPISRLLIQERFYNPATGQPMEVGKASNTIQFTCLDASSVCAIRY